MKISTSTESNNKEADIPGESKPSFWTTIRKYFSSVKLIFQTIAVTINWFANSFIYYGISMNTVSLVGNPYLNATLAAIVEFFGVALCHFLISRFGRKYPYAIFMFLSGASLVCIQFVSDKPVIVLILALICKLSISFTYNGVYIVTAEIFPTSIRATMLTICNSISRLGGVIAPSVQTLSLVFYSLPFLIYGGVAFVSTLVHLIFIKETKETELLDNIEDAIEEN